MKYSKTKNAIYLNLVPGKPLHMTSVQVHIDLNRCAICTFKINDGHCHSMCGVLQQTGWNA